MSENKRFTDKWCSETGEIGLTDDGVDLIFQGDAFLTFLNEMNDENVWLKSENKKLQERNNRQYKQLKNIYDLIEKQDWKQLQGLIEEFKECEEKLKREWRTYSEQ